MKWDKIFHLNYNRLKHHYKIGEQIFEIIVQSKLKAHVCEIDYSIELIKLFVRIKIHQQIKKSNSCNQEISS